MGRAIDLTNQKFGELTVLRQATKEEIQNYTKIQDTTKTRNACWWVQCSCGKEPFVVQGRNLRNGKTQSCGHLKSHPNSNRDNLEGQKFGKLTVLNYVGSNKNGFGVWHCKCDCGNEKDILGASLKKGETKSCGCLKEETYHGHPIDYYGQRFGFIEPLYPTDDRSTGKNIIWHCKCHNCGNELDIASNNLKRYISCGCIHSKGEYKIKQILNNNKIPFKQEKTFENCISPITNAQLKFDFFINNSYLIEYDGEQHFYSTGRGWNNEEHLKEVQYRDKIKDNWCKENHIPLIRIPYTHYNDLCLEDLLLETSKYII